MHTSMSLESVRERVSERKREREKRTYKRCFSKHQDVIEGIMKRGINYESRLMQILEMRLKRKTLKVVFFSKKNLNKWAKDVFFESRGLAG